MLCAKIINQENAVEKLRIRQEVNLLTEQKKQLVKNGGSKEEIDLINEKMVVLLKKYLKILD